MCGTCGPGLLPPAAVPRQGPCRSLGAPLPVTAPWDSRWVGGLLWAALCLWVAADDKAGTRSAGRALGEEEGDAEHRRVREEGPREAEAGRCLHKPRSPEGARHRLQRGEAWARPAGRLRQEAAAGGLCSGASLRTGAGRAARAHASALNVEPSAQRVPTEHTPRRHLDPPTLHSPPLSS